MLHVGADMVEITRLKHMLWPCVCYVILPIDVYIQPITHSNNSLPKYIK